MKENVFEKERLYMKNLSLYKASRLISAIFNPFMVPFLAYVVLFIFTYLNMLPLGYRFLVLSVVFAFTILLPALGIFIFRKMNGWGIRAFRDRKKRYVPWTISIISYLACFIMMNRLRMPSYMSGIILASILSMIIGLITNVRWKICEHMIACGGVVGGLIAFSMMFNYNPLFWLSFFILLSGSLGTARIVRKHHTLGEVIAGFSVGFIATLYGILYY
jgi:hypothetical protein